MEASAFDFLPALTVACAGSFHCAGMCGGFLLAAGVGSGPSSRSLSLLLLRQLPYHLGKMTSYIFLGALAGAGAEAAAHAGDGGRRILAAACGLVLLIVGLAEVGIRLPRAGGRRNLLLALASSLWVQAGRLVVRLPMQWWPLLLGAFSGLLPCPLVYAFLAAAAATGSVLRSMVVMGALAAGTAPALLAVALSAEVLTPALRRRLASGTGLLLIALAFYTWYRGWIPVGSCHAGV